MFFWCPLGSTRLKGTKLPNYDYESHVISIPDYPELGIIFKDVTPLFKDPTCFKALVDDIAGHFANCGITKVIGAEARGFLIGAPVAYALGAGFIPARKPGKLPREVFTQSYDLEYGTDELQIHKDALNKDDVVLIADDLVATGGTCVASARLAEQAGARVEGFTFALELCYLDPRTTISKYFPNTEVYTLIKVKQ